MGHSRWFGLFISQGSEWVLNSGCREREREKARGSGCNGSCELSGSGEA